MIRTIFELLLSVVLLNQFSPGEVLAQVDYKINSFQSTIKLKQNTDLLVIEEIRADFDVPKHGIFRIIPVTYSARGRTINADLDVLQVTDEIGNKIRFDESKLGRSVKLKIGDPSRTITGEQVYVIEYRLSDVVRRFDDYDEIYWNVTGSEWDTTIDDAGVYFVSKFAGVKDAVCYAGVVRSEQRRCAVLADDDSVTVASDTILGSGSDFTVVFTLDKNNQLIFPTRMDRFIKSLKDNWDYVPSVLPLFLIILIWFKKGRDKRYVGDTVYYEPKNKNTKDKPVFAREHIPLMYHPVDNLTPSEVGTIVDEKVDIEDVMAEIVELARLGYMGIVRVKEGGLFSKNVYAFIKNEKSQDKLRDYQKLLLKEIFRPNVIHKSVSKAEKIFKSDNQELEKVRKLLMKKEYVLNTALENHFYESLPRFKKKLYEGLSDRGYFDGNPDIVRKKWVGLFIGLVIVSIVLRSFFFSATGNFGPMLVTLLTAIPGVFISYFMPRKTAKGYMYARQSEGLRYYLRKGQWRYEIEEKKLFLEEMLPLAMSLGVVGKLTKDMSKLGIKPPNYTYGFPVSTFSGSFRSFESGLSKSLMTTPGGKWSGSGSWSGGSGFSGGSVGGGFGGGGGGSW